MMFQNSITIYWISFYLQLTRDYFVGVLKFRPSQKTSLHLNNGNEFY